MNTLLIGFLSPKGIFTPCRTHEHMRTAAEIMKREYPNEKKSHGLFDEKNLLEEKSYVSFPLKGCVFYGDIFTDEQRLFLEENINNANNPEQKAVIERLLLVDTKKRLDRTIKYCRY